MGIKLINQAVERYGSQIAVAKKLGITPQRLNNWIRAKSVPKAWEWGLADRLRK